MILRGQRAKPDEGRPDRTCPLTKQIGRQCRLPIQLQVGQEALFILNKQAKEDFYVIGSVVGYFFDRANNPGFDKPNEIGRIASANSKIA